MRFLIKKVVFLCVVGLGLVLPACAQDDPNNLSCLLESELPPFGSSRNIPQAVDVDVEVTVGTAGLPSAVVLTPRPQEPLAIEIEYYLRDRTEYDSSCSGKKVKLRFSFRVEGEPMYMPFERVWFRPPNHFTILTQPREAYPQRTAPVPPKPESDEPKP